MADGGELVGEFMREMFIQLAYLRYEVARLKGETADKALAASAVFMEQGFETMEQLLQFEEMDWQAFQQHVREAVQEMVEKELTPNR